MRDYKVRASFDDEANVWYVSDSELPGLSTCADTLDALIQRVQAVAPELAELNSHLLNGNHGFSVSVDAHTQFLVA